jgi:hypothetical protein
MQQLSELLEVILLWKTFAGDSVSSIANHIQKVQLARRKEQVL